MPNDLVTLQALANELNNTLAGGKIEKIFQPEKDEISIIIRSKGVKHNLVISCNAQNPRIHISAMKKENPITAPTFCMHLRKYISSGIIESVSLLNQDRIFLISIIARNELKDTINYGLIAEMMGRYSNILLINGEFKISDAMKQVSFDSATKRCILPSVKYTPPDQVKILPSQIDKIKQCLTDFKEDNLAKYLYSNISGISPETANDIIARCNINLLNKPLNDSETMELCEMINRYFDIYNDVLYSPCVNKNAQGKITDYYTTEYIGLNDCEKSLTLSQAIESLNGVKDIGERHREKTKHLSQALKKYKSRNEKKLQKAKDKLIECENMNIYKKYGDIILGNLHSIKKGDTVLTAPDYYEDGMPNIDVPLNIQYTPSKCAQDYFKKYNKLKRTKEVIVTQIIETEEILEYAKSIESSIENSVSSSDLLQIEEELYKIGAIKKLKTTKNKSVKAGSPIIYEYADTIICVGKNNIQNDKLTFKTAHNSDIWLHSLQFHGSHVVVFTEGCKSSDELLTFAAELAAYYSQGKSADKVPVDYTEIRNVKRNPNGNLGMVTYTKQHTIYVTPKPHLQHIKSK